jgi:hypothetical protein
MERKINKSSMTTNSMPTRKILWCGSAAVGLMLAALLLACSTDRTTGNLANIPPETHLYLVFADTLQLPGESTSMQVLHWYGDDPDGEVVGYEYRWNYDSSWIFTTDVTDTFFVPIRVPVDTFTFSVRAVDNSGLRDETPAHLSFPIINSHPTVIFPVAFTQNYSHTVYNCFSYFSINWSGSDPDGDATITGYYLYLADSSFHVPIDSVHNGRRYWNRDELDAINWERVDSLTTIKVFNDLQPGSYRFFLRCRDVADAYSDPIIYPDTDGAWNVKPVVGSVLFIDDDRYAPSNIDIDIDSSLTHIYGPNNYSTWVAYNGMSYNPRDIEETLKLFPVVVWHGGSYPHFRTSGDAINRYIASGGHLLAFSTQRYEGDTTIYPFMPIDTFTTPRIGRSFTLVRVPGAPGGYPDTLSSNVPGFPSYPLSKSSGFRPGSPAGLLPGTFEALYTQRADFNPSQVDTVAARYPASNGGTVRAQVIYFSAELYLCSARFGELLSYILQQEFGNAGR